MTKPQAQIPDNVVPFPVQHINELDELAEELDTIPDDILLAYFTTRFQQSELFAAYREQAT